MGPAGLNVSSKDRSRVDIDLELCQRQMEADSGS
jgi:hypothetical protein